MHRQAGAAAHACFRGHGIATTCLQQVPGACFSVQASGVLASMLCSERQWNCSPPPNTWTRPNSRSAWPGSSSPSAAGWTPAACTPHSESVHEKPTARHCTAPFRHKKGEDPQLLARSAGYCHSMQMNKSQPAARSLRTTCHPLTGRPLQDDNVSGMPQWPVHVWNRCVAGTCWTAVMVVSPCSSSWSPWYTPSTAPTSSDRRVSDADTTSARRPASACAEPPMS